MRAEVGDWDWVFEVAGRTADEEELDGLMRGS